MSLQMGCVESPPFFCTALETAWDVATNYIETPVCLLPPHKFEELSYTAYSDWWDDEERACAFRYLREVYVHDFIALVIPTCLRQNLHVANGVMFGIHDVFPTRRTRQWT